MNIHPTALVDPKAELAEGVEVGPFTIVGPGVRVGKNTLIGPHCVLDGRTVLGEGNRVFSGAQIGILSQDMKHNPTILGRTVIGDNNFIREHVTISASTIPTPDDDHRVTSIGNNCWLMAYTHVGHDCHLQNNVIMANCASLAGHVEVEDYANLGGLVGVHQECVIGAYCFVGGMTRVSQDIPPYMLIEGNPARCRGINAVGLRRRGFDDAGRSRIKEMYRIMFRSDRNVTQALHEIERVVADSHERTTFVEFYRKSIRGVTR